MKSISTLICGILAVYLLDVFLLPKGEAYAFSPNLINFDNNGRIGFTKLKSDVHWTQSLVYFPYLRNDKTLYITFTDFGFEPSVLIVHQGDSVTFKTMRDTNFWPASDPHPTHNTYSKFDPQKAIKPGETWTYTFDQVGVWGYHDHLTSAYSPDVGVVRVLPKGVDIEEGRTKDLFGNCDESAYGIRCWASLMRSSMFDGGIDSAFDLLKKLYDTEPYFSENCNDITHYFGGLSYRFFKNRKYEVVTSKSLYCGGGFYHGFLEVWFHDNPKVEDVKQFCDYMVETLKDDKVLAMQACYHGIGHGAYHAHLVTNWDDFKNEIKPAFKLCEKFGEVPNCINGVFVAVVTDYYQSRYSFLNKKENPFRYCENLSDYKEACYRGFVSVLMRDANNDLTTMIESTKKIEEKVYVKFAIETIMHVFSIRNRSPKDIEKVVLTCRNMGNNELYETCLTYYLLGLVDFGKPGTQYLPNFVFCDNQVFSKKDEGLCHKILIDYSKDFFSNDQFKNYCHQLVGNDRDYCMSKIEKYTK